MMAAGGIFLFQEVLGRLISPPSEGRGQGFESLRVRHFFNSLAASAPPYKKGSFSQ